MLEPEAMMALFTQLVGTGRPDLVFLHGLFGRGKNWAGIARALADHDHTSVLFDLPNHGRSGWTDTFDYGCMADEVADELRLRLGSAASVSLVGHSMGGKVAMLLALRHPGLVKSLVVVDIAPDFSSKVVTNVPLVAAMRALDLESLSSRGEAERLLAAAVDDSAVRQFLLQNLKHTKEPGGRNGWQWELNLELLGDHLDEVAEWPEVEGVSYDGPVLWVAGADSPYIRPEHAPRMRQLFPRVRLVRIPGAGHWVHADAPAALTAELAPFLN
ncbi:alpha/beta fold hydrolase [Micropruina sp.]|uniref:alpha/beta fold hydrolase n=1 Tax=Micropruina sp. TaxID=2737536 RepID=UPI0039E2EC35